MIGERRHRLRIEKPIETRGTSGQELIEWDRVCEVWCRVTYKVAGSKEDIFGDQPMAQTSVIFDIAYRDGLNEKMRVVFDDEYFDILYFQKPDFRTTLLIYANKQQ